MALIEITSWTLTPLNPDGSDNTLLPSVTDTVPTNEVIDWGAMGQKFRLTIECEMSGTYPDTTVADLDRTIVRYNPSMFLEPFAVSFPVNTFPAGGYTYQVLSVTPATYVMNLSFPSGEYLNSNINGDVTLEVVSSTEFIVTHEFRLTMDLNNYLVGANIPNNFRLTKASIGSPVELSSDVPSVYGYPKALNVVMATRNANRDLFAENLSIGFQASFNNLDSSLNSILAQTVFLARASDITTEVDSISAFEDTYVKLSWSDPSALITLEEAIVILTRNTGGPNVGTFERDFLLMEAKLLSTGSGATIDGAIKGPVVYTQAAGITTVSFYLDHTQLNYSTDYDLHSLVMWGTGPSDQAMLHAVLKEDSFSESVPVIFGVDAEFWSRNANHANNFEAAVMERLVNVLTIDTFAYTAGAEAPYTNFWDDLVDITFTLSDTSGNVLYAGQTYKIGTPLLSASDQISKYFNLITGTLQIVATEFRIPFENFQGLLDMGADATNDFVWTWKIKMVAALDDNYQLEYQFIQDLNIRQYENSDDVPSGAPKVSNIQFLNPLTGLPISNWCDITEVLVVADIDDLGPTTYVNAFVDSFPLGAIFQNDFALEEEDPATHTTPSYVIFEQKATDLISEMDDQPTDGVISFLLDVSNLTGDEKYRISVMAYRA